MERHHASIWEAVADEIGSYPAIIQGPKTLTWHDYELRASSVAAALLEAGLKPGSKVATYLYNCAELLEARFATLKIRAVPVNVNYKYLPEELWYVLDNSDSEAVVFHSSLAAHVDTVRNRLPKVRAWIQVDDGGPDLAGVFKYEVLVSDFAPAPRINRSPDDIQLIYTGGTTGRPKGVMIGIGNAVDGGFNIASQTGFPQASAESAVATTRTLAEQRKLPRSLIPCPLMHGTGIQMGANPYLMLGGCVILTQNRKFDSAEIWDIAEKESATNMTIVGDAMARPLLHVLDQGAGFDLSSVAFISSSGAMFSRETKAGLVRHMPNLSIWDLMSSTEGRLGQSIYQRDSTVQTSSFSINPQACVFDENDQPIAPGSGVAGQIAVSGNIPFGYYKDPVKTAATFREINGIRWSFPGDFATVHENGTFTLIGRSSSVINTGGEKVYGEEVEEAIKRYPGVADCLVLGMPDERFGEKVVALVSAIDSVTAAVVKAAVRDELASYKTPKNIIFTSEVPRTPSGKADYKTARTMIGEALASSTGISTTSTQS